MSFKEFLEAEQSAFCLSYFVPSVERDGQTPIDQKRWVDEALEMLGRVFLGGNSISESAGYLAGRGTIRSPRER